VGMNRSEIIIDDFDGMDTVLMPFKTDAPLLLDANGVLSSPVTTQPFQSIRWRNKQILLSLPSAEHPSRLCVFA